jgi:hypothetical protein
LPDNIEFITVYVASSLPEAEIIRGRLGCENIPSILRYEAAGVIYGLTVDGLGQVEVRVPSRLAKLAREVLAGDKNEEL